MEIDPQFWLSVITIIMALLGSVIGFVIRGISTRIDKNESRSDTIDREGRDRTAKVYERIDRLGEHLNEHRDQINKEAIDVFKALGELRGEVATKAERPKS